MEQTYYDILNLPKYGINEYTGYPISNEKIKEARDNLIFNSNSLNDEEKQKIEKAYGVLSDRERRRKYDEWLKKQLDKKNELSFSEIKESKKEPIVEVVEKKEEQNPPTIKVEEKKEKPIIENEEKQPIVEVKEKKEEQEEAIAKIESKQTPKKSVINKYSYSKIKRNLELVPKYEVFIIEDVKTEETKLIEEYEEKLINEIYELLSQPPNEYNGYNIEISKLKYENQIRLLKKRIELKENQQISRKEYIGYWFNLLALKFKLSKSEKKLENLKKYIENYTNKNNSKLGRIYMKIDDKYEELEKKDESISDIEFELEQEKKQIEKKLSNIFRIKNLEIKRARALEKKDRIIEKKDKILERRDAVANKMVLYRNGIVRKTEVLIAYNITKNKINDFVNEVKERIETYREENKKIK